MVTVLPSGRRCSTIRRVCPRWRRSSNGPRDPFFLAAFRFRNQAGLDDAADMFLEGRTDGGRTDRGPIEIAELLVGHNDPIVGAKEDE